MKKKRLNLSFILLIPFASVFVRPDEVLVTSEWLSQNLENSKVRIVEVIVESFVSSFASDQFKSSIPELPWLKASVSFIGGIFLG